MVQRALHKFEWEDADKELDRIWGHKKPENEWELQCLASIGTPGAVKRVVEALEKGQSQAMVLDNIPRRYREVVWELLASLVDKSQDEYLRWYSLNSIDRLWDVDEPRPWEVTECFFRWLENEDKDVRERSLEITRSIPVRSGPALYILLLSFPPGTHRLAQEKDNSPLPAFGVSPVSPIP